MKELKFVYEEPFVIAGGKNIAASYQEMVIKRRIEIEKEVTKKLFNYIDIINECDGFIRIHPSPDWSTYQMRINATADVLDKIVGAY